MVEVWKDVEGYEGLYQVSNLGRVKSLDYHRTKQGRILKSHNNIYGYPMVQLYKNKESSPKLVHRLVAQTFIPNPENKPQVNHIDENKENNRVENLEWCTVEENSNHGTRNERIAKSKVRPVIGISVADGHVIAFESLKEAERNGFNHQNVSACCLGKRKTCKGYVWKYIKPIGGSR